MCNCGPCIEDFANGSPKRRAGELCRIGNHLMELSHLTERKDYVDYEAYRLKIVDELIEAAER